jgi:hypothetical protein
MNKTQKIIAGIIALIAAATIITTAIIISGQDTTPEPTPDPDPVVVCPIENNIVTYSGEEGKTAFDILDSLCTVETISSDFGEFVTGIDGISSDETNYWAFYVNNDYATVGASSYETKEGDVIKWQLEDITY